jgi:hypothetical protein
MDRPGDELPYLRTWKPRCPSFERGGGGRILVPPSARPPPHADVHPPDDVRESTTITLRFDPRMLSRIKRIARRRYLNYQSMIKQWLSERMEQETRGE